MQTLSTHLCLLAAKLLELGISGFESFFKGFFFIDKVIVLVPPPKGRGSATVSLKLIHSFLGTFEACFGETF